MTDQFPSLNKFKYLKNYKTYCTAYGKTFNFDPVNSPFKIGEQVIVGYNHKDHADKKGVIGAGVKKDDPSFLKVVFSDGKSDYINKNDLIRNSGYYDTGSESETEISLSMKKDKKSDKK